MLESHSGPIKGLPCEARSGDSSADAVATALASLSNFQKELSLLRPLSGHDDVSQGSEIPKLPSACGVLNNDVDRTEIKDSPNLSGRSGVGDKVSAPSPNAQSENLNLDTVEMDSVDPEVGKEGASGHELRPVLRVVSSGSAHEFDLSGSISRILDHPRDFRELLKNFDNPILNSTRKQVLKDIFQQGLLDPCSIEVSFENFPYYLR